MGARDLPRHESDERTGGVVTLQFELRGPAESLVKKLAVAFGKPEGQIIADALGLYNFLYEKVLDGETLGLVKDNRLTHYRLEFRAKSVNEEKPDVHQERAQKDSP